MYILKKTEIYASEISEFIQSDLVGNDFVVQIPVPTDRIVTNSFTFLTKENELSKQSDFKNVLIICDSSAKLPSECSYIISKNPKLDFVRVINEFFVEIESFNIAKSAKIHPLAKLSHNVSIGENCVIGSEVIIGDNTQIMNNVVISSRVEIGSNCIIKDNSTLGSEGYDFEIDEDGFQIHYPNIGKINIGNAVWIGSNTTIENTSLKDTIIKNNVKIDDLVHIGSGCIIEENCMITAGVIISQNVILNEKVWIAPNATIRNNLNLGKNSFVGTGSVVIKDVEENHIVVGNPAKFLKENI